MEDTWDLAKAKGGVLCLVSDGKNPDIAYVPRVGAVGVIGLGLETGASRRRCSEIRACSKPE